jgi:F-type H+-transporting ATPase subunit b
LKRTLLILICTAWLSISFASQASAQETIREANQAAENGEDKLSVWKWANFAILAIAIGYFAGKALPAFFADRTTEIQKGISEAAALKADAEKRVAEMERRMAALGTEIEQIRTDSRMAMATEAERLRYEAETHMNRIQSQADQEVEAHTKRASLELKAHTAQLALQLAEQKIRAAMNGDMQGAMIDRFVQQLDRERAAGAGL